MQKIVVLILKSAPYTYLPKMFAFSYLPRFISYLKPLHLNRIQQCNINKSLVSSFSTKNDADIENTDIPGLVDRPRLQNTVPQVKDKRKTMIDRVPGNIKIKTNPKDTTIMMFPGQGSQFVGMGSAIFEVPNVEKLFSTAKAILGYDLLKMCLTGPIEMLNKTEYCQPAIYVTSLAAIEYLRSINSAEVELCVAAAGFSIGEITALVFAGAMSFEDGLRLVKLRGEAMQYASELVPSAMATTFFHADANVNLACQAAREWCKRKDIPDEYAVCSVANYLFAHCKVIAGHEEAIKFLELSGKDFGLKKMRRLPVSGAFHTSLMEPVTKVLAEALKQIKLEVPLIPVYSNFDANVYRSEEEIRRKLTQQVCKPVKWEQILHNLYDRPADVPFPRTYECGPGTALLSTLSMVNRAARQHSKHVKV